MGKARWLCMPNSLSRPLSAALLASALAFYGLVQAKGNSKEGINPSARFAEELSRKGSLEITSDLEACVSRQRPLLVNQEIAEIFALAARYSAHIRVKSECEAAAGEAKYKYCRLYLHSPSKAEQWSMGFSFLGDPLDGEIKMDSLRCFSTP